MGDHGELHYGFFGLTALGPTSSFKQGQMLSMGASTFTDEEWMQAFDRFDADGSGLILSSPTRSSVDSSQAPTLSSTVATEVATVLSSLVRNQPLSASQSSNFRNCYLIALMKRDHPHV